MKEGRLTDLGCIFALLTLPYTIRKSILRYDFDARENPRRERVPRGQTVVVTQNNVQFLLAWKGTYVFTGGKGDMGWLLQPRYPDDTRDDTYYAPVVSESLVKVVLSIIAVYDLKWRQVDFKAAYLNETWVVAMRKKLLANADHFPTPVHRMMYVSSRRCIACKVSKLFLMPYSA